MTEDNKKRYYGQLAVSYIQWRYSSDDEAKIIREYLAGKDKGAFEEYDRYVEECKARAHKEVYGE